MKADWTIAPAAPAAWLDSFPQLPRLIAQALYNRGLRQQSDIDTFLSPDYSRDVLDPFLFRQMKTACDRLYQAIDKQELITVHGDYDADGVSGSVILSSVLKELGARVDVFLPHREKDGYGLNPRTVDYLQQQGTKVIITCDCGISNLVEIGQAKELGIDTIVTDHHQIPPQLPPALAIIHPKVEGETYPFKDLAGGGVAFKLVQALLRDSRCTWEQPFKEAKEKWLLDLVAISTVADMVSLRGENRVLVKYGLVVLQKNRRPGLAELLVTAKLDPSKIDSQSIAFQIAPRINAAGRVDHANTAYVLLVETDPLKAQGLAVTLNQTNIERQKLTEIMFSQAKSQFRPTDDPVLFFYQADWPLGLTGLVAGKLTKEFNRPCLVMASDGQKVVGSGRSVGAYNILTAVAKSKDYLLGYGGHPMACGFRLPPEQLEAFKATVLADARGYQAWPLPALAIEAEISFRQIDWELADYLQQFAPYGIANEQPLFVSRGVEVVQATPVGKDLSHLKLILRQNDKTWLAIAFGFGKLKEHLPSSLDIAYAVDINQWNGNRELQLQIKDIKL